MQHLLKPHLLRFKSHHLPLPKSFLKLYHPVFSPQSYIATLPDSTKHYCQIILIHEDNYLHQLQNIDKRIQYKMKCKHLVEFKGFSVEYQGEGGNARLFIYYEMGIRTFKGIFKSYSTKQQAFWRIFFPIVRALAFLQKQKISHGNLNRYSILFTQSYQIKLLYNINQPTSIDLYYQDSTNSDWQYLFLSPEQLNCQTIQQIDIFKSDVFNLGVIFLIHLLPIKQGDYGDQHYLQKQIQILKQKYSYCLCNVIKRMLDMDWQRRPRWFEIGLMLDEMEKQVEVGKRDMGRLYTDVAPKMSRDLLSMADLKETRRTGVSEFSCD